MELAADPQPPKLVAQPIDVTERVALLDVIRGLALGGVFLSNVYMWFSGMFLLPPERTKVSMSSMTQEIVDFCYGIFVSGKFMTIFTFLFGVGLAVQFGRATDRNDSAPSRYARRAAAMVFLGALHVTLVWYGDIVHVYALIGLFVLLFRNRSTKTLFIWGAFLTLVAVPAAGWIQFVLPRLWTSPEVMLASMNSNTSTEAEFKSTILAAYQGSSYVAVIRANVLEFRQHFVGWTMVSYHIGTLGNFLLGYAVGRAGWFKDVDAHRQTFRRLLGWGAFVGIVSTVIVLGTRYLTKNKVIAPDNLVMAIVGPVLRNFRTLGFAIAYVAAIALLFQRGFFRRLLSLLAPAGRMALSNYFAQSVIAVFVFYGIGLGHMGDLRPRWVVIMPMVMFTVQIACSHLWLRWFRFGPAEWVLRSLTYGKAQPMRVAQDVKVA